MQKFLKLARFSLDLAKLKKELKAVEKQMYSGIKVKEPVKEEKSKEIEEFFKFQDRYVTPVNFKAGSIDELIRQARRIQNPPLIKENSAFLAK